MTRKEKEEALDKLHKQIEKADLPLKTAASRLVPGEGNPNADVVFVGEAPGVEEDKQGRPFVGAAGKFLNQLIESIGWKREDVYIANLIKHRPPNNRDPLPIEIEAYTPWLDKQLDIIKPKLIVTLGRYSMAYFLGEGLSITKVHGQPKRKGGRVVMPMYHPAAALYRGDLRPVLAAEFKKIPKVLEMIKEGKVADSDKEKQPVGVTAAPEQQRSLL
ncbi:MAG: uracil-DNA glycosylase [Patescibacteria group bacterium]